MNHLPESLRVERDGNVLTVRLCRPHKRNALDDALIEGISRTFSSAPSDVRAAVLFADGDNFSAGLDLSELTERSAEEGFFHSRMWHAALERVEFGVLPVVSALKGAVVGGGLELASATHIRVAEPSAFYCLPEGSRGIFVGGGASVRIPRLIGFGRTMDLLLTGRVVDAEEGQRIGLSQYLVGEGEGFAFALELARRIAENAPMTNYGVMHALPRIVDAGHAQGLLIESLVAGISQDAPVAKQRLRDFLEKRAKKVTEL